MSIQLRRALCLGALLALGAVLPPVAGAHAEFPHYSFDTLHALGVVDDENLLEQSAVAVPRASAISFATGTKVECIGDGTSGKRVQVMYVRDVDTPDGYAASKASIGAWALGADHIYRASAAKTMGPHRIRFVHDAACNLSVLDVVVDDVDDLSTPANKMGPLPDLVRALGYNDPNRKYLMFVDNATTVCGVGTGYSDDQPGQANAANGGTGNPSGYTRIDFDKGNCNPEDWIAAHELSHNLGAVQDSAPNSTGKGHCIDDYDRVCQDDKTGLLSVVCSDYANEALLDCNDDDYFNAHPAAGSYLDTNWNLAHSDFLASSPGDLWGFARANDAAAASYTPDGDFQRNSTNATSSAARTATGVYELTFANLAIWGGSSGNAEATSYGSAGEHCTVSAWDARGGPDEIVTVRCYDAGGNPVDSRFDASFIRPTSVTGDFAYLWANDETNAAYTPSTAHQFNSTGGVNTVTRSGTGAYRALLPGLGSEGGTVKVTAFGASARYCKVESFQSSGGDEQVDVRCYDAGGAAADVKFLLTYADGLSVVANDASNGYVWANNASAASYTPDLAHQWNSTGATNTIARTGAGLYTVTLPGLGSEFGVAGQDRGTVHVTAHGTSAKRCEVVSWSSPLVLPPAPMPLDVDVACHTPAGVAADSKFLLQFTK